jgi:hypothetical protein
MRTLDTIYQFNNGKITALEIPPQWLEDAHIAYREHDDWERALSDEGAVIAETYGVVNESVDVWRYDGAPCVREVAARIGSER